MPYVVQGGKTIHVSHVVQVGQLADPPDDAEPEVYNCPECGKEYKTEHGLSKHLEDKH